MCYLILLKRNLNQSSYTKNIFSYSSIYLKKKLCFICKRNNNLFCKLLVMVQTNNEEGLTNAFPPLDDKQECGRRLESWLTITISTRSFFALAEPMIKIFKIRRIQNVPISMLLSIPSSTFGPWILLGITISFQAKPMKVQEVI